VQAHANFEASLHVHHGGMTSLAHFKNNCTGYSLLDTLFALFIVAVLCGVAASSMQGLQTVAHLQTAAQALHAAVLNTRTQALRLEKRITLCAAAPNTEDTSPAKLMRCHIASDGSFVNAWRQGWLMFEDDNNNGVWDVGEARLAQQPPLHSRVSAMGNTTVSHFVSFGASGRSLALNGAFQAGTLTVCERQRQNTTGWHVVVNAVGRPRLEKLLVTDCPG
jgi:type IV fimbrial biogenesis protein FimT